MPNDSVLLNGVRYLLARDKKGTPLYSMAPTPFFPAQSTAEEVTEAAFPPEHRQPYSFRDLSDGAGQSEVPLTGPNRRYDRIGDAATEGVDCSLTPLGPILLAPAFNVQVLSPSPGASAAARFRHAIHRQNGTVRFNVGRYVYSWGGSAFTQPGDINILTRSLRMISFRGAQSQDYWYVPITGGGAVAKYSTDAGVTWTNTPAGHDSIGAALAFVVADGEVVFSAESPRQGSALVASFDDGGSAPTRFGVIDPVGDPTFTADRLMLYAGRILVLKDGEGVFALSAGRRTLSDDLFPELRYSRIYFDGATIWRGLLWLPTSQGLYVIGPNLTIQAVGPERREARSFQGSFGPIVALAGDAYHLYAFRKSPSNDRPAWLLKAVVRVGGGAVEEIAWHDLIQLGNGKNCAAMQVFDLAIGGGTPYIPDNRLLLDYFDEPTQTSDVAWVRLPGSSADPRTDPSYLYASAGTLYYSRQTARFPQANKVFFGLHPLCADLSYEVDGVTPTDQQSVTPRYKLDTTALTSTTPFGYTAGTTQTTGTGSRESFVARGRGLDTALRLTTGDNGTSPQVRAATVDYTVEPTPLFQHHFTLDVSAGAIAATGSTAANPMPPGTALATLRALPASGTMPFVDPWGNAYTVTVPLTGVSVQAGGPSEEAGSREIPLLVSVVCNEQ